MVAATSVKQTGLQLQRPTAAMRGAIEEGMARSQVATHAGGAVGARGSAGSMPQQPGMAAVGRIWR